MTVTIQRIIPAPPWAVTPSLLRQLFAGALDMSTLPMFLQAQIKTIVARMRRQAQRADKHETKHAAFAIKGLNGTRAMARRRRQIAAGSLRVENGLVPVVQS